MDQNLTNITGKIKTAQILKQKNIQEQQQHQAELAQGQKPERLPPGQRLLNDRSSFPVLDLGVRPEFNHETYKFTVYGLVENTLEWGYQDVLAKLPKSYLTADFHCVTRWSQYGIEWAGFKYLDLEKLVKPKTEARFVIQYGLDDYSTNVPIEDLRHENVLFAYELHGKPLPQEHGWPLRLIIPGLYGWKGSKFLFKLKFQDHDEPDFWETRGYHNHGDPWKEERYG